MTSAQKIDEIRADEFLRKLVSARRRGAQKKTVDVYKLMDSQKTHEYKKTVCTEEN